MTTFDTILAVIAGYCVLAGIFRGLVKEIILLGIVLAGFIGALLYYPVVAARTGSFFAYPEAASFFGFLAVFLAPILLGGMIMFIISRMSGTKVLSASHRLFGCLFGALRGALLCAGLIIAALAFPLRTHPLDKSRVFPVGVELIGKARSLFPQEVARCMSAELDRLKKENSGKHQEAPHGRKQK